jgi:phosphatidate cytidylyltransferase
LEIYLFHILREEANIKDTGKILPGHGGILDRLDGIIFALPFSYLLLKFI